MEAQMKAICEGRTTRNDVVQQNLEQYRAVFNRTVQQINVLKSVGRNGCSSLLHACWVAVLCTYYIVWLHCKCAVFGVA